MNRILVFAWGVANYALTLGTAAYLAGFMGNLFVRPSLDSAAVGPLWQALLIDTLLVALFGLQHSVMARPTFKRWWTRVVPESLERGTYLLFTNAALILLFWQWRPTGGVLWDVQTPLGRGLLLGLYGAGLVLALAAAFVINHFDLLGLRQAWLYLRGKPYTSLAFRTPGPYRLVRHPLYAGLILAFWATPTMTVGHLVFALGMTVYILIAIPLEERNLAEDHGEPYAAYRRSVPMLLPFSKWARRTGGGQPGRAGAAAS